MAEAKPQGRPMIYPYTFTAKFMQFPYKYYFEKGWCLKYFLIGAAVTFPVYVKITQIVNSPENVLKWKKIREDWYGPNSYHG